MSTFSCEVWQPNQNLIRADEFTNYASTSPNTDFLIDVFATYVAVDDDDPSISSSYSRFFQFMAQRQVLIDTATSWSTISSMLSHMLVPFHAQPSMIQKISTCAREIATLPGNVDSNAIKLVVSLVVGEEPWNGGGDGEEEAEVPDDVAAGRVLERVNIGGCCVICLEEIPQGGEASRLPCLHIYHERCILRWLEKSNLCPLCRFQVPLD